MKHMSKDCRVKYVICGICRSNRHPTGLHDAPQNPRKSSTVPSGCKRHGGEEPEHMNIHHAQPPVVTKCTQICKEKTAGKSCAKIVQVQIYPNNQPKNFCKNILHHWCSKQQITCKIRVFLPFGEQGSEIQYSLYSCSGTCLTSGRRASNYTIESLDGKSIFQLTTLIECNQIPNNRDEIPTPDVARCHPHLRDIASLIPPIHENAQILLLLGRDIISVHHVQDQCIGGADSSNGRKLNLGWVVIVESCIWRSHKSDLVNVNKTFIIYDGQPSYHPPCLNNFHIKDSNLDLVFWEPDNSLFLILKEENKCGRTIEDRQFDFFF